MREDAILRELEPDVGFLPGQRSLKVMPSQIGIVIRDGEVVDVFESGRRDLQMGNVRTYVASTAPFDLKFNLKDPFGASHRGEGTVLDQFVLTMDREVVTGRIDLTLRVARENVEYLLQLRRQESGVVMWRDVSDAIKGELLAKVLAPNIRGYTAKELLGNRELLDGIEESVKIELVSTIQRYGLHLTNLTVMWGPTRPLPPVDPPMPVPAQPPTRTRVGTPNTPLSLPEKYRAFWQPLVDILREEYGFTRATKGGRKNWKSFSAVPSLSASVWYRVVFARSGQVMVNIYIGRDDREWNEQLFDKLRERKGDIEAKLGKSLCWDRMDGSDGGKPRMACRIAVYRPGTIDNDPEMMEEIREWMIERLLAFNRVFGPILEELAEEALVMELLRLDRISEAEAAESLDLDRWELIDVMGRYRVPSIRVTPEELRDDLAQSIQDAKRR